MNTPQQQHSKTENKADTAVRMQSFPDPIQEDKDNDGTQVPDESVKEPLTPVPAQDEVNPPLKATLGGDVVTQMEIH